MATGGVRGGAARCVHLQVDVKRMWLGGSPATLIGRVNCVRSCETDRSAGRTRSEESEFLYRGFMFIETNEYRCFIGRFVCPSVAGGLGSLKLLLCLSLVLRKDEGRAAFTVSSSQNRKCLLR